MKSNKKCFFKVIILFSPGKNLLLPGFNVRIIQFYIPKVPLSDKFIKLVM